MALGTRGGGTRSEHPRYPSLQAPDDVEGGGGGGGTPPTAPSDITVVGNAPRLNGWGGFQHAYASPANYVTMRDTYGFSGHNGRMGNSYLSRVDGLTPSFGNTQVFRVSSGTTVISAAGSGNSAHNYQAAYEGLSVPSVNGGNTGYGLFKAKQAGVVTKAYLTAFMCSSTVIQTGPWGDWSDNTIYAGVAGAMANRVAGVRFLGGDGIYLDFEKGKWQIYPTTPTIQSLAEQRGYEVGNAIWGTWPECEVLIYHWIPEAGWHYRVIVNNVGMGGGQEPQFRTVNSQRTAFILGLMRAHGALQATGVIRHQDAVFYRAPTQIGAASRTTQMQCQLNGLYAHMSRQMSQTTRDWTLPRWYNECCSWAGTDSGGSAQPLEPAFTQMQADYKIWSSGGWRAEYTFEGTPLINANLGVWAPNNNYSTPAGRLAGLQANAVAANHPSTAAPTLSATKSGTGSTRTITGSAAHPYAIHWVRAYIYPSGTPVYAAMTWNEAGSTYSSGFANAYMEYTINLTGVASGNYAIVQAQSPFGHQKSTVVAL